MSGNSLTGTVALITGASSGIGEASAVALARAGATVVLAARREERLIKAVDGITSDGGQASYLVTDLTTPGAAGDMVAACVARHGRVDTVVNNAGLMLLGPAREAPPDEWSRMIRLNIEATMWTAHAALEPLITAAADGARLVADLIQRVLGRWALRARGISRLQLQQVRARRVQRITATGDGASPRASVGHRTRGCRHRTARSSAPRDPSGRTSKDGRHGASPAPRHCRTARFPSHSAATHGSQRNLGQADAASRLTTPTLRICSPVLIFPPTPRGAVRFRPPCATQSHFSPTGRVTVRRDLSCRSR